VVLECLFVSVIFDMRVYGVCGGIIRLHSNTIRMYSDLIRVSSGIRVCGDVSDIAYESV